jgi:hypothetical protein
LERICQCTDGRSAPLCLDRSNRRPYGPVCVSKKGLTGNGLPPLINGRLKKVKKVLRRLLSRQKYRKSHCLADSHLQGLSGPVRMVSGGFVSKPTLNLCGFDAASPVTAFRTGSRLLSMSGIRYNDITKEIRPPPFAAAKSLVSGGT